MYAVVMAALGSCGDWLVSSSARKLIAVSIDGDREPFVYDCSQAEQKPKEHDSKGDEGGSEEKGSDRILAFAVSVSGKLCALTDDNKRLVLFNTEPSWKCVSTRWVVRRCTSLVFNQVEDELLVADKSGDVYSFSVSDPHKPGDLKLGHLSMLLAVAVTPDDRFIITADRDEKIRVSCLESPYKIQSFCLGHSQFVSALCLPPAHPQWLLSGSGDGTLKLWDYESGRRLQSLDLKATQLLNTDTDQRLAICGLASSPDGRHVAAMCESVPAVQLFQVEAGPEGQLSLGEKLTLTHSALGLTFDPRGQLWVLQKSRDRPVFLYKHAQDRWEPCDPENPEVKRVTEVLRLWRDDIPDTEGVEGRFQHLYKVNFDNMASYLQKKQERIQQKKQEANKKRAGGLPQSNGVNKRSRKTGVALPVPSAST